MKRTAGFTILEVLLALTLFSLVATSMTSAFLKMMRANTTSEQQSGAVAAAQLVLDRLRLQDPADMPESGSADPEAIDVGDRTYDVVVEYCPEETYCTSNSVRHIRVTAVLSTDESLTYTVDTVYAQLQ